MKKCDMDCFNCKLPSRKCKGGGYKSPHRERNCPTVEAVGHGKNTIQMVSSNRRKGKYLYD